MRVQNGGTGKSSWWMINPDAKPGKAARRRATSMETQKYEKKRGRVKKKIKALKNGLNVDQTTPSPSSSVSEGLDMFPDSPLHRLEPSLTVEQMSQSMSSLNDTSFDLHMDDIRNTKALNLWTVDVNHEMQLETDCPHPEHNSNRCNITLDQFNMIIDERSKVYLSVESICFVDMIVTLDLLRLLFKFCPKLNCLHISRATFETQSLLPLQYLAPNITCLSANGSIRSTDGKYHPNALREFLDKSKITDLSLMIGGQDDFTGDELDSESLRKLDFFCIKYEEDSHNSNSERKYIEIYKKQLKWRETDHEHSGEYVPVSKEPLSSIENAMRILSVRAGSNLRFLRIVNYVNDIKAVQRILLYMINFTQLIGFNIGAENYLKHILNSHLYYKIIAKMDKLETLTIPLPSMDRNSTENTNRVLSIITTEPKFKDSLKRFRLINAKLGRIMFEYVLDTFINIRSLQLVDCFFYDNEMDYIAERIIQIRDLDELIIEITISDTKRKFELNCFTLNHINTIFSNCHKLEKFQLKTYIDQDQLNLFKELAEEKNLSIIEPTSSFNCCNQLIISKPNKLN